MNIKNYIFNDASLISLVSVFILTLVVCAICFGGTMYSVANIQSMGFQIPEIGLISLAMMLAFLVGGIDLSIVANACLSGILVSSLLTGSIFPSLDPSARIILVCIFTLLISTFLGFINGFIISSCAVSSLIATLGTMTLYSGIGLVITGGKSIVGFPEAYTNIGIYTIYGVPLIFIFFILIVILFSFVLEKTRVGRQIYLFGENPVSSLFSGINNTKVNILIFSSIGFIAGLVSLIITMRVNSIKVGYGDAYIFQSLIICVIAGIHPAGGRGKVVGIAITAVLMQIAASAFTIMQLSPYTTKLIWGFMLITVLTITKDGRKLFSVLRLHRIPNKH